MIFEFSFPDYRARFTPNRAYQPWRGFWLLSFPSTFKLKYKDFQYVFQILSKIKTPISQKELWGGYSRNLERISVSLDLENKAYVRKLDLRFHISEKCWNPSEVGPRKRSLEVNIWRQLWEPLAFLTEGILFVIMPQL